MGKLSALSFLVVALTGCATSPGEVALFGGGYSNFNQDVKNRIQLAHTASASARDAHEKYKFITGITNYPDKLTCPVANTEEPKLSEKRLENLDNLKKYFDTIKIKLQISENIGNLSSAVAGTKRIASLVGGATGTLSAFAAAEGLVSAIQSMASLAEQEATLYRIAQIAASKHNYVVSAVKDIEAGLKSINISTNASLKTWEQCEYEMMFELRKLNSSDIIQLERRFSEFQKMKSAITSLSGKDPAKDGPILSIIDLHKDLFTISDTKELLTRMDEQLSVIEKFKKDLQAVEDALKALKSG